MMQGDAYSIPIEVKMQDRYLEDKDIEDMEVLLGLVRKTFKSGEITYDRDLQKFMFPLSQEDTFRLKGKKQPVQIRIKTPTGEVMGMRLNDLTIDFSDSREVL